MATTKPTLKIPLEERLVELNKIRSRISRIEARGIRESSSLDILKKQKGDLQTNIWRSLLNDNEKIHDSLLDYCFVHFGSGLSYDLFERMQVVRSFVEQIKESKGQKVLSLYGKIPSQIGIISDSCEFVSKKTPRHLYVPVEKLFVFNSGEWQVGRKEYNPEKEKTEIITKNFHINPDIFKYPAQMEIIFVGKKPSIWETDHSKETYLGGGPPEETTICIGNKYVDSALEEEIILKTERKIKPSAPI